MGSKMTAGPWHQGWGQVSALKRPPDPRAPTLGVLGVLGAAGAQTGVVWVSVGTPAPLAPEEMGIGSNSRGWVALGTIHHCLQLTGEPQAQAVSGMPPLLAIGHGVVTGTTSGALPWKFSVRIRVGTLVPKSTHSLSSGGLGASEPTQGPI